MSSIEQEIKQDRFQDEFSKSIVNLIYTSNFFGSRHNEILKPFGLTTPQFNVLRILRGQHPNPCTVNLLIDRMLDKSSNASRIVDKLELKGLVIRKQCTEDRRAVDVLISSEGLGLLQDIDKKMVDFRTQFEVLTEKESRELNHLLDKMRG